MPDTDGTAGALGASRSAVDAGAEKGPRTTMQQAVRAPRSGLVLAALAVVSALLLSACSDGHQEVRALPAPGWAVYGGTAGNTNATPAIAPGGLKLVWTRPTGGPITAPLTLNRYGDVGVTARTPGGCNMFVFDQYSGRKTFCKRLREGAQRNALAFDQNSQPYIGEETTFLAFNVGGAVRWRMPVIGVPLSAKFAGPGQVLMSTTQGQLLLLNAQTNTFEAPEVRLREDADPDDPRFGFNDCLNGGPLCALPAPPAVDTEHERFYLDFRPQGSAGAQLLAMSYAAGPDGRALTKRWSVDVPSGMMGPATVSADGATVYAHGRDGALYAYSAEDGAQRWRHDLGGFGFATLAVSPDGLIIPTGGLGTPLTILRDRGDAVEVVAQRTDLQTVSLSTITGADSAWTVVRTGADQHLVLTEVSTADGTTKRSLAMPGATGFATGVAVSAGGNIAVATNLGEIYYFAQR